METIFESLTILTDSTVLNSFWWRCAVVAAIWLIIGVVWLIYAIDCYSSVWAPIIAIVLGVIIAGIGIKTYLTTPYDVNLYVAINDVDVTELVEYFDISDLAKVDDMTVCHITPKPDYYNEVLTILRKGD